MAFSPAQDKENETGSSRGWGEVSRENPLGFISAGVSLDAQRVMDPRSAERIEDEARKKTLRALNALRIVGPLLAAIQERIPDGSNDEVAREFMSMVEKTTLFSRKMSEHLGIDSEQPKNFWIRNVLERICAETIKERWLEKGDADVERLLDGAVRVCSAADNIDFGEKEIQALPVDETLRIALMKAMGLVLSRMECGFDFFRNMDSEAERVGALLMRKAAEGALVLSDPHAGERERASLFSVAVEEAARLYGAAWIATGRKACDSLAAMSDEKLNALLAKHKEGLPVTSVDESFRKNFERMISVTAKLIPPKSGGSAERLGRR